MKSCKSPKPQKNTNIPTLTSGNAQQTTKLEKPEVLANSLEEQCTPNSSTEKFTRIHERITNQVASYNLPSSNYNDFEKPHPTKSER